MISHGHVKVSKRKVSVPGYIVKRLDEANINYDANSVLNDEAHPLRKENMPGGSSESKKD